MCRIKTSYFGSDLTDVSAKRKALVQSTADATFHDVSLDAFMDTKKAHCADVETQLLDLETPAGRRAYTSVAPNEPSQIFVPLGLPIGDTELFVLHQYSTANGQTRYAQRGRSNFYRQDINTTLSGSVPSELLPQDTNDSCSEDSLTPFGINGLETIEGRNASGSAGCEGRLMISGPCIAGGYIHTVSLSCGPTQIPSPGYARFVGVDQVRDGPSLESDAVGNHITSLEQLEASDGFVLVTDTILQELRLRCGSIWLGKILRLCL